MTDQPPTDLKASGDAKAGGDPKTAYRVLARKYRPARFAELIGQEALVRTLTNAIESGRVAQAFILTGVRGVGKTTTARIIARALNCVGPDGTGGPTPEPCGVCANCIAIAQDRHVDVIEMDAASRTGIDDIRELIEGVRYRPVQARNKVYIVDEVHMLSKQAFNGLLKTLEEPPEHVIFVFATTEIRKVPVTVLSRCQRFDLRRVDQDVLRAHFAGIAKAEGVAVADEALAMIARAADGSVRDGLSLLDQAIALSGGGEVSAEQVRTMLGLADRGHVLDLFEAVIGGKAPEALAILADLHAAGADPSVILQDLLEFTHVLTRAKLVPETLTAPGVPEAERVRGRALAEALSLAVLARAWQMLLKGLGETQFAPLPVQAAEMVLIRLAYAADLPTPVELVERLQESAKGPASSPATTSSAGPAASAPAVARTEAPQHAPGRESRAPAGPRAALATKPRPEAVSDVEATASAQTASPAPATFPEVVALVRARKETILANHLENDVHLVRFDTGRIELRPSERAPRNLAGRLGDFLQQATGERWMVSVSQETGEAPLRAQAQAVETALREAALSHPLVQAALAAFPGAKLLERRGPPPGTGPGTVPADTGHSDTEDGNEDAP
jgi:DNA polymerase-3 subunit gamma/tau